MVEYGLVDCHAQVGFGETWAEPKRQIDYDLELVLNCAAEAGIDQSCIAPPRNKSYDQENIKTARWCEKYPKRLIGFAVHSPQRETGRLQDLLRVEVKSMGLKGLKVDGHPTREILDVVAELGIPVIYDPEPGEGVSLVRMYHMMALSYPTVSFILPHLGSYRSRKWWAHIEAIDLVKRHPNIYLETSGVPEHKYLEMAARELAAEKIIFGSYAPELDPRVEIHAVKLLKLPRRQEVQILRENMRRLLRLQS